MPASNFSGADPAQDAVLSLQMPEVISTAKLDVPKQHRPSGSFCNSCSKTCGAAKDLDEDRRIWQSCP